MKEYFISYSQQRTERARLRRVLMDTGLNVWRDVESLYPGLPATPAIEREISKSHGAVLWISESFLDSEYIQTIEIPAFQRALQQKPLILIPVFDGISPTKDKKRLDRVAPWIREQQGLILRSTSEEAAERHVARRCVRTHTAAAADTGQQPIVRLVSYDDTAPLRERAVLNFDWSEHMTTDSLGAATRSDLRWALTTAAKALKSSYGATEIHISIKAHLGFGVALGHEFSEPTGCLPVVLTADGTRWSPDADSDVETAKIREETLPPGPATSSKAAVEIAISRPTTAGVDSYTEITRQAYRYRRRFTPIGGPSRFSIDGPPTAASWARQIGQAIVEVSDRSDITGVDLFLSAPIQIAVLIGYWLNSAGRIRIMNWKGKTGPYEPIWTLS